MFPQNRLLHFYANGQERSAVVVLADLVSAGEYSLTHHMFEVTAGVYPQSSQNT